MKSDYSRKLADAIEYSREEAIRLQNSYIGPEHLMLGILREGEGRAIKLLRDFGVEPSDLKRMIEREIRDTMSEETSLNHEITVSKATERVLRMSILEARLFSSPETGTEHLLLAILKEQDNIAAAILGQNGITYQTAYDKLQENKSTGNRALPQKEETISDG